MMKGKIFLAVCAAGLLGLSSCGSSRLLADGNVDETLTIRGIIRNHEASGSRFRTLSGRLGIDYSDGEDSQSVTVSLRMKRNEVIWMSAPLGVIKVYITPQRVSYYNKLNNEFFDGDFSYLSRLLGAEIDFEKLQNLLLGQSIVALQGRNYELQYTADSYELKPKPSLDLYKLFLKIEPRYFRLASQQLAQPEARRIMEVRYSSYQEVQGEVLPDQVRIAAIEGDGQVTIGISYKQVELNRDLRFPYKIPKGFNPVALQ
jgi:hypothetical protein